MEKTKLIKPRNDEIVNYLFRPAKNIERKMMCEALSRLSVLDSLKNYQYVGFGSVYFADFSLFHKVLGINNLTSIESDDSMELRVRFNQPYSCINIKQGWSYDVLPDVDLENIKTILWLDYTDMIKSYMFKDITTFFSRALSGSIFIMSINVDLGDELDVHKTSDKIKNKLKKDPDVKRKIRSSDFSKDLKREDYYSILRDVINNEILGNINNRNLTDTSKTLKYKQIFNFLYKDGVYMLTIGGILYSDTDEDKVAKMNFENLDFIMSKDARFEIKVPHLTYQEIHAINKFLPNFITDSSAREKAFEKLKGVVSEDAIKKYANIYRHYPIFTESNI